MVFCHGSLRGIHCLVSNYNHGYGGDSRKCVINESSSRSRFRRRRERLVLTRNSDIDASSKTHIHTRRSLLQSLSMLFSSSCHFYSYCCYFSFAFPERSFALQYKPQTQPQSSAADSSDTATTMTVPLTSSPAGGGVDGSCLSSSSSEYVDRVDRYRLCVPSSWIKVDSAGQDVFFRSTTYKDTNLFVDVRNIAMMMMMIDVIDALFDMVMSVYTI